MKDIVIYDQLLCKQINRARTTKEADKYIRNRIRKVFDERKK